MVPKLFTKSTLNWLLIIGIIELVSLLGFLGNLNNWLYILILAGAFVLTLLNLKFGLYIALLELFIGSQGHLFFYNYDGHHLAIRIGLFCVINLAWIITTLVQHKTRARDIFHPNWLLAIGAIISLATANALINHVPLANIFFDVNAWLYFGYIFLFLDTITIERLPKIFELLTAAALAISIKTLIIFNLFSHNYSFLDPLYHWIRDTRIGEITLLGGNIYRIFFQSHIILIFSFFLFTFEYLRETNKRQKWWFLFAQTLVGAAIIISLSRSNWLGLALTIILAGIFIFIKEQSFQQIKKYVFSLGRAIICSLLLCFIVLNLLPQEANPEAMLRERFSETEAAASSRQNQLGPLINKFWQSAFIGSGFGTTITYRSLDPRIVAATGGQYTTYTFELGYLDLLIKFGLFGLFIYLGYLLNIIFLALHGPRDLWPLGFGLLAIIITHAFSPYINHPLGIGLILIITCLTYFNTKKLTI